MKSALELALEKLRRLEAQTTPEEREASRREYYFSQGQSLGRRYLEDPFLTQEKVEGEVERLPAERRELVWQGFWYAVLQALRLEEACQRAEALLTTWGGEAGEALLARYHALAAALREEEEKAFADCVAHFRTQERLRRLEAAGLRVDYPTVARQSRTWQQRRDALRADHDAQLAEAKAAFWQVRFGTDYPSNGKKAC
ncbi:MAG: hypothetical protein KatS3mg131_3045 [Candidatus Tectimicrobiota bacterium]|nr:MAG: hypothetical protein KatS3mg131_3045 [Candidatus Tectomicrobia bacterium]